MRTLRARREVILCAGALQSPQLLQLSGVGPAELTRFFAKGMLLNVVASMDLLNSDEPWARRLVDGCKEA